MFGQLSSMGLRDWTIKSFPESVPQNFVFKTVTDATLQLLVHANQVNWDVKRLLPYGAGNQIVDNVGTQGHAWARVCLQPSRLIHSAGLTHDQQILRVKEPIRFQAGNCGQTSAIAFSLLASMDLNAPVFRVKASDVDHGFVVIGDEREISADKVVVVDPWSLVPVAHTLEASDLTSGEKMSEHPPKTAYPMQAKELDEVEKISERFVLDDAVRRRWVSSEETLLQRSMRCKLQRFYNHVGSIKSFGVSYCDAEGNTIPELDKMPLDYQTIKDGWLKAHENFCKS
ncbi:MAG: hypothetical protein LW629_10605 [Burkholderiales bacterium]|nr:hypothetical protein [Burkholderiales bacterium]